MSLKYKSFVSELKVYEPGKPLEEVARELGFSNPDELIKLASNENNLGPSPKAIEAMKEKAAEMNLYPDGSCHYLREALSEKLGIPADHFILGNGSNEIIELIAHVFLEPGTNIVMSEQAFIVYKLVASAAGADAKMLPMNNFKHDLDAMANAVDEHTRVVFVANPNNPTGTIVDAEALALFLDQLPEHVLAVLDEAYVELLDESLRLDINARVLRGDSLIVLRTFSKVYGLAGLRIGYGIATPEIIHLLQKFRQPFNVNLMAQHAALAALSDEEHVKKTSQLVKDGLAYFYEHCAENSFETVQSNANFLLIKTGAGRDVFEKLQQEGIIVRPMDVYGLPDYIRVSIGLKEENEKCMQALIRVCN